MRPILICGLQAVFFFTESFRLMINDSASLGMILHHIVFHRHNILKRLACVIFPSVLSKILAEEVKMEFILNKTHHWICCFREVWEILPYYYKFGGMMVKTISNCV